MRFLQRLTCGLVTVGWSRSSEFLANNAKGGIGRLCVLEVASFGEFVVVNL